MATKASSEIKHFDVAKPGTAAASPTSRPVIVTNRPIMQDPMMVTPNADEPVSQSSAIKIKLRPLSETKADADDTDTTRKDVDLKSEDVADQKDTGTSDDKPENQPTVEDPSEPIENPEKIEAIAPEKPQPEPIVANEAPLPSSDENESDMGMQPDAKTAALEAALKRAEAVDKLIEERQYFLPINAIERRRSKLVVALGLLLIVVLALALVDLMLDAGFIHIPGVQPLTHIFRV